MEVALVHNPAAGAGTVTALAPTCEAGGADLSDLVAASSTPVT